VVLSDVSKTVVNTKTFLSRPRLWVSRPYCLSSRRLETKTGLEHYITGNSGKVLPSVIGSGVREADTLGSILFALRPTLCSSRDLGRDVRWKPLSTTNMDQCHKWCIRRPCPVTFWKLK